VAHPHVTCAICTMAPSEQVGALQSNCVDVGISVDATKVDHIVSEPLWTEELVAALPADHPLATEPRFDLSPLTSDQLMLFDVGTLLPVTAFAGGQSHTLRDARVIPQHVPNVLTLLTLVSAGLGIGLTTAGIAGTIDRSDVVFRPLSDDACTITVSLLRRDTGPSPLVEHFVFAARAEVRCHKATVRLRSSGASVLSGNLDRAQ
jgi:DNA-binding transcriptional LysR family regulator